MSDKRPCLAVSMGDPVGVGPEVLLGALGKLSRDIDVVVFGDAAVFKAAAEVLSKAGQCGPVPDREIAFEPVSLLAESEIKFGKPSKIAGDASYRYVATAARAVMNGQADALVTAPISKQWWIESGHNYTGHTEFLAELAGVTEFAMMLAGPTLRVVPVTTHMALSNVVKALTTPKILSSLKTTDKYLKKWFGVSKPKIACAALNPHAGESGKLGDEEDRIIAPAIKRAVEEGVCVEGPFPADTLFARREKFDAIVCMYHDQALIPIKTLHPFDAVNITLGLPFVRTSPDHGTAYDIAGKGVANPDSMLAAMEMAADIVKKGLTN